MNPLIVIPTYVTARSKANASTVTTTYDTMTMLTETGELPGLLESLVDVEGVGTICILVVSDPNIAVQAAEKVQVIAAQFPELNILVIGRDEHLLLQQRMEQLGIGRLQKEIGLAGYGASKNLGLLIANALGFDSVVFLTDDTIIEDTSFLKNAVYGLGKLTRMGIPILAKSGYTYNKQDQPFQKVGKWYTSAWDEGKAFNEWLTGALKGSRLSRSNYASSSCMIIHREAFRRVAFDPWIARGEDVDYMLNLRMYGSDMWFDNRWNTLRIPAKPRLSAGQRFKQNAYRWMYELRKLEFSRTQIDLLQLKTDSMEPFPGPFMEHGIDKRMKRAALLSGLFGEDKDAFMAARKAVGNEVSAYAEKNCNHYFDLQRIWPEIQNRLANDQIIATAFFQTNAARQATDSAFAQNVSTQMFGRVTDEMVQQTPAAAAAPAPEAGVAPAAPAASVAPRGVNLDPGSTGEIRMNMADNL